LVADGAGETFLVATATAASTATTTPATAIAVALLLAAGRLVLTFLAVLLGLGILFTFAGRHGRFGRRRSAILAQLAVARATAAAPTPAALAALAVLVGSRFAASLLLGEAFGFFGLDLGFQLRIEFLVVIGF
ncbi:hypothetical protein, partial [Bradyrhizobium japonicum]|uniref:hypothetical protein n=1 Tax=Bradyrhizobium japonicum TaxID=375 RepID=UPI00138ABEC4